MTVLLLTIAVDGRAKDCRLLVASGSLDLDKLTCASIIAHARYQPGLDKTGQPVPSHFVQAIRWERLN